MTSPQPTLSPVNNESYDAILVVSFGGPEHPDHVMPFLENVLRGRNVPKERMLAVAEHYHHFGGVSPINSQVRDLIAALEPELRSHGITLPIFWGNRNWHPLLPDTMAQMRDQGVRRALALVLSANSSYSGCRQYRENILAACASVGESAPTVDKIRVFYNHPDFIAVNAQNLRAALSRLAVPVDQVRVAFTAHSIPLSMANGSPYALQLAEAGRLIAEAAGVPAENWNLVYQSRSGRPEDPWLDPDILEHIRNLHSRGVKDLVIAPIGFLSDHIEVLYDLDDEALKLCQELGVNLSRAATPGTHPQFVCMLRKLIAERLTRTDPKESCGLFGPNWDVCPSNCCPAPIMPRRPTV